MGGARPPAEPFCSTHPPAPYTPHRGRRAVWGFVARRLTAVSGECRARVAQLVGGGGGVARASRVALRRPVRCCRRRWRLLPTTRSGAGGGGVAQRRWWATAAAAAAVVWIGAAGWRTHDADGGGGRGWAASTGRGWGGRKGGWSVACRGPLPLPSPAPPPCYYARFQSRGLEDGGRRVQPRATPCAGLGMTTRPGWRVAEAARPRAGPPSRVYSPAPGVGSRRPRCHLWRCWPAGEGRRVRRGARRCRAGASI